MTGTIAPNLPQGYVQLTEGRIRSTDLVLGKSSTAWIEPHAFTVGREVGEVGEASEGGTRVARRIAPPPKTSRVR